MYKFILFSFFYLFSQNSIMATDSSRSSDVGSNKENAHKPPLQASAFKKVTKTPYEDPHSECVESAMQRLIIGNILGSSSKSSADNIALAAAQFFVQDPEKLTKAAKQREVSPTNKH